MDQHPSDRFDSTGDDAAAVVDPRLEVLAEATRLLASLTPDEVAGLTDPGLVAFAKEAERAGRLVEAVQVAVADQVLQRSHPSFAELRLDHRIGATGAAAAIMALGGLTRYAATKRLRAAAMLLPRRGVGQTLEPLHPVVGEALFGGRIGLDAALSIVKHLEKIAPRVHPDDLARAESAIVGHAVEQGADVIPAIAARVRDLLDPDGAEPRDDERRRSRFLRLVQKADGMLEISGLADPASAARLLAALGTTERTGPVFRSVDEPDDADDGRTAGQRMLDRLVDTAEAGAEALVSNRASRRAQQRARLVLVATLEDFQNGEGVARFLGTDQVVPISRLRELADTQGGRGIETALFGENGRVLALGRKVRAHTERQRFALVLRDGTTCARAECSRSASQCDAHHIVPWAQGGATDVDNGVLLCSHHHWLLHQGGGSIVAAKGRAHYRPPTRLDRGCQLLGQPAPPRIRRRAPRPAA